MAANDIFKLDEINPLIAFKLKGDVMDENEFIELSKCIEILDDQLLTIENLIPNLLLCKFTYQIDKSYLKSYLTFISLLSLKHKNNHDFMLIIFQLYNHLKIINHISIPDNIDINFIKTNITNFLNFIINKNENRFLYLINKLVFSNMTYEEIEYLINLASINYCAFHTFEDFFELLNEKLEILPHNKTVIIDKYDGLKKKYEEHALIIFSIHEYSKIKKLKMTPLFEKKINEIIVNIKAIIV